VITGRDTAFVLRTWPLRESDFVVSVYAKEYGRIRGVARGATKPKGRWAGALDAMTEVSLEWKAREGEELLSLTDGSIVRSPYRAELSLETTWALAFVAELVDLTAPAGDADETLYRLLRAAVDAALAKAPPVGIARYVQAWVLRLHGILPDEAACVACGEALREGGTWHWSMHGIACGRCHRGEEGVSVLPEDLAFLEATRRVSPSAIGVVDPAVLRRVGNLLRHVTREALGRELRSERFLDELDRGGPNGGPREG
jgi:DNA repair protein RecO (recombination protein O)